jgi:hypothetical protein
MDAAEAVKLMKKAVFANTPEFQCFASENKVYIRSFAAATRICRLQLPGQAEKQIKLLPGIVTAVDAKVTGSGVLIAPDGRKYDVVYKKAARHTLAKVNCKPVFDGSGNWLKGVPGGVLKYPENILPAAALQPELRYFKSSFNPEGHNISAQYWTAYDEENFYLAVKVDDPIHMQRQKPTEFWRDDCLQFVLSHESGDGYLKEAGKEPKSEFNYAVALTPQGTRLYKFGKDSGLKEYPAKVTRNGNTTFYEVSIPWKAIGGKAKRFGFVVFNNNWSTKASAPYYLYFTEGVASGADDTKLKVLDYAR